jgi:uncharacterized protein (DUF1330 family)
MHADVLEYLAKVRTTFKPYGGQFRVHGDAPQVVEGAWPGDLVIVEFPGVAEARAWYDSAAYQEIKPLRTRHFDTDLVIVKGVAPDYDPAPLSDELRRQTADRRPPAT